MWLNKLRFSNDPQMRTERNEVRGTWEMYFENVTRKIIVLRTDTGRNRCLLFVVENSLLKFIQSFYIYTAYKYQELHNTDLHVSIASNLII
jgi:hypothetical protein